MMKLLAKYKKRILRKTASILGPYILSFQTEQLNEGFKNKANIGKNVIFSNSARIDNNQKNKNKITIGDNCLIYGNLLTYAHGGNIELGKFVFIGENSKLWSSKNIKIGNHVLISHNVNIHDNNSHPINYKLRRKQIEIILTKGLPNNSFETKEEEVVIEDDVWIGFNATINKGVTIGKGSIIGSNAVVYKDVPSFSIVMGNPGKIITKTN